MTDHTSSTETTGGGEMDLHRHDWLAGDLYMARMHQADLLADADAAARARRIAAARRWARRADRATRRAARASAAVR
ncbi:hypothetical protein SAMN05660199_01444 [Klenkia soli]|uniref:Uncharacterized protein n=1 Tax=Klenkia soli TaxID=1052260 RepID=A0A1H0HFA5_9ACTN|nr:hypothetical protein [Klenkia soli]SDO17845.1 hypothetical protein SAMN05660199_01444 [Klenkia soli]